MDEAGNDHSQKTNTKTENQTLHVLIHEWELNNENTWTQGEDITHWGLSGEIGEGQPGGEELGRDNMGRNARYR